MIRDNFEAKRWLNNTGTGCVSSIVFGTIKDTSLVDRNDFSYPLDKAQAGLITGMFLVSPDKHPQKYDAERMCMETRNNPMGHLRFIENPFGDRRDGMFFTIGDDDEHPVDKLVLAAMQQWKDEGGFSVDNMFEAVDKFQDADPKKAIADLSQTPISPSIK